MTEDVVDYFDRFYQATIKEQLNNPIVNSEWSYFSSMLRAQPFDHDRVELYLTILQNEKNKPKKNTSTSSNSSANKATSNNDTSLNHGTTLSPPLSIQPLSNIANDYNHTKQFNFPSVIDREN